MKKRTKIICTMGPNTDDRKMIKKLIENGMDIARFNFSHGDHEEQRNRMNLLKSVRDEMGVPVAILLDTKGPEIRTGTLKDGKKVTLEEGKKFTLTIKEVEGTSDKVSITYDGLTEDVEPGNRILIDDGLIELEVQTVTETDIVCKILNGGELGERKGVNVPNVSVKLPALTDKDKEDILFGIKEEVDFIAASFVRSAEGVLEIKALLKANGAAGLPIIAKIENAEGIKNIDEIIHSSDGVMVARGDLGVEIPAEKVPYLQKKIISKCNEYYKPVITATQMLDSMMRNPRPTRAEVTDVANAVYDGTDAVMLSGETAVGKYPIEALKMMRHICINTEEHLDYDVMMEKQQVSRKRGISSAIGYCSVATAESLGARCIITPTVSGATARLVSKFKPKADIIGISPNPAALRKMQIYWGVQPIKSLQMDTIDDICENSIEIAWVKGLVETGDIVVLTAGIPSPNAQQKGKESTMMRIAVVD